MVGRHVPGLPQVGKGVCRPEQAGDQFGWKERSVSAAHAEQIGSRQPLCEPRSPNDLGVQFFRALFQPQRYLIAPDRDGKAAGVSGLLQ
jgi:hypothetical protein